MGDIADYYRENYPGDDDYFQHQDLDDDFSDFITYTFNGKSDDEIVLYYKRQNRRVKQNVKKSKTAHT